MTKNWRYLSFLDVQYDMVQLVKEKLKKRRSGILLPKFLVLTYCEKNCFSDRKKLLKFEAEGREFAKTLRSLEQFF